MHPLVSILMRGFLQNLIFCFYRSSTLLNCAWNHCARETMKVWRKSGFMVLAIWWNNTDLFWPSLRKTTLEQLWLHKIHSGDEEFGFPISDVYEDCLAHSEPYWVSYACEWFLRFVVIWPRRRRDRHSIICLSFSDLQLLAVANSA